MKEDVKMKENMNIEPTGTMPQVGAMQQMQAAPNVLPAQAYPNTMPAQQMSNMGVMPSMMSQVPVICCPYLMNMQCPMTYGQNVMGANMMNNLMYPGVSPISGKMNPVLGAAENVMDPMMGMGTMPASSPFYPMGGM